MAEDKLGLLVQFLHGLSTQEENVAAHGAVQGLGGLLLQHHPVAEALGDLFGGMLIFHAAGAAIVGNIILELIVGEAAVLVKDQALSPDLIHVHVVGIVHLVGDVAAGGAHIHFQTQHIALLAQAFPILVQTEELEVEEAVADAEGLHHPLAGLVQILAGLDVLGVADVLAGHAVHHVHGADAQHLTGAEKHVAVAVGDAVEGLDVATCVDDDMSFGEAFAAARDEVGAGGVFLWRGNLYGTYYRTEWDSMTDEQKDEYWQHVYHTDYQDVLGEDYRDGNEVYEPELADNSNDYEDAEMYGEEVVMNEAIIEDGNEEVVEAEFLSEEGDDSSMIAENEIEVLGVHHVTADDGSEVILGELMVNGESAVLVDVDNDGIFDVLAADTNGDGNCSESEMLDISGEAIGVDVLQSQVDESLYADNGMGDYVNDAEV